MPVRQPVPRSHACSPIAGGLTPLTKYYIKRIFICSRMGSGRSPHLPNRARDARKAAIDGVRGTAEHRHDLARLEAAG